MTDAEIRMLEAQRVMYYRQDEYEKRKTQFRRAQMLEAERLFALAWAEMVRKK